MRNYVTLLLTAFIFTGCAAYKGERGSDGKNGETVVGPKGDSGERGSDGIDGEVGPAGADGEIARVVQLCPGYSNYGVFIEVGMCINGQLWGVYSANGGFMTLLAPGRYSSNGIGSACSFTILPNCVVTP